jgi:multiple sugar transport system substrate-binding protein
MEASMADLTRRVAVKTGTALAAAAALTGPALLDWATAWAQTAPWKPEKGAQLSLLRWKYFVQAEDDAFVGAMDAFAKATGVKVGIIRESNDDVQPKALRPTSAPVRTCFGVTIPSLTSFQASVSMYPT